YVSFAMIRGLPRSADFPYTTLFRSQPKPSYTLWRTAGSSSPPTSARAASATMKAEVVALLLAFIVACEVGFWVLLAAGLVVRYPDRKSTRLNSSHVKISYAVFCLKK